MAFGLRRSGQDSQRSELEFRQLLEKLPAGAYTCDPEGLITYFNPHAVELWGRPPKLNDPVDRFCGSFRLFSVDGSPIRHDECWMALALREQREFNGHEIVIERPNGERITALAHANPIRDDSGKLLGAVNVLVDISDRKRAEDALKEADRYKNEFVAMLAHELRNPLAPIRNAVQILHLPDRSREELDWALGMIDRQMEQMTRLIDDLMDLSRITRNSFELRKQAVTLADVMKVALETSGPLLEAAGQKLEVQLPPRPLYLDADLTRLAQAISNILNNAARYSDPGGQVRVVAERQGSQVVIRVEDTGIGISSELLPRVFEMFTQVDRSPDRPPSGLGIGLTLVKRFVEMHGGSVEARSEGRGRGSEFTVLLPLLAGPVTPVRPSARLPEGPPRASGLRILVVDDNRDSADSLATLLGIMGNDTRAAHSGAEGAALAAEFRPDVALLDLGLPHMDGCAVAQKIRQQPWGQEMLLVAVTGWGQQEDRHRSREAGFDHHLVKPVDPAALAQLLSTLKPRRMH